MPILKQVPHLAKPTPKYTYGRSVPTNGRRACYDYKTNTYTRAACKGDVLLAQGIGVIEAVPVAYTRAFSIAFSSAFG